MENAALPGGAFPKKKSPEPEATATIGREIAVPGSGVLSDVDLGRGIRSPYGALNHLAMISTFVFVAPPRWWKVTWMLLLASDVTVTE